MRRALYVAVAVLLGAPFARADLIELRDGRKLSGSMSRQGDVIAIKTDDGRTITAKPDEILKVTLTGSVNPVDAAAAEWTRIAQQIRTADDLRAILALHRNFLEKHPQAANAAEVRSSMGVYEKLVESNAVKFRGRWVARAHIDVMMRGWADAAKPALDYYKAGRFKEALDAARAAIDADKENPDALAVGGLAALRANNITQARAFFTALVTADPGNPLAENNLAVISFQQKQAGQGLAHFSKALQLAPDNRIVLDNIIEAVNLYLIAGNDRSASTLKNLQRQFEPAEKRMEEAMAKEGMVRRGSTWVTRELAERMAADLQSQQRQYSQLEAQYIAAKNAVLQFENLVRQVDAEYNAALVSILIMNDQIIAAQRDGNGTLMLNLLASRDLTVANATRLEVLRSQYLMQREQVIVASQDLFAQAEKLQAAILSGSVPLSGSLKLIDLVDFENQPATAPQR